MPLYGTQGHFVPHFMPHFLQNPKIFHPSSKPTTPMPGPGDTPAPASGAESGGRSVGGGGDGGGGGEGDGGGGEGGGGDGLGGGGGLAVRRDEAVALLVDVEELDPRLLGLDVSFRKDKLDSIALIIGAALVSPSPHIPQIAQASLSQAGTDPLCDRLDELDWINGLAQAGDGDTEA